MEQVSTVIISLLFLLVGYFLGRSRNEPEVGKQVIQKIKKASVATAIKAGVLEYPTQDEIDYHGSEEEKADIAREALFKSQFKP